MTIADGDKRFPTSEIGNTAKKVKNTHDYNITHNKSYYGGCYILESVTEIENLIPMSIMKQLISKKKCEDISGYDLLYYDIKEGINYKCLFEDEIADYWKTIFDKNLFAIRDELVAKSKSNEEYCNEVKKMRKSGDIKDPIKPAFGNDVLENVLKHYQKQLDTIEEENLFDWQKNIWNEIGELFYSWTCAVRSSQI